MPCAFLYPEKALEQVTKLMKNNFGTEVNFGTKTDKV